MQLLWVVVEWVEDTSFLDYVHVFFWYLWSENKAKVDKCFAFAVVFFPEFSFVLFIMFFLLSIPSEFFWNSIQNVFKRIKFFHFVVCLYVYRYTISVWKKMSFSCFVFLESKREVFLCQSNGHFKEGKKKLNWDRDRKIRGRGANHLHIINDGIHTH